MTIRKFLFLAEKPWRKKSRVGLGAFWLLLTLSLLQLNYSDINKRLVSAPWGRVTLSLHMYYLI